MADGWLSNPWVSVVSLAVAGIALVVAIGAWRRMSRLKRRLAFLLPERSSRSGDVTVTLGALGERLRHLEETVSRLDRADEEVASRLAGRLRTPGVVRFNAFGDMGSDLSFAVALLDDEGDGVVLSAIQGREQSRLYAKPVRAGRSAYPLSPEELRAISAAGMQPDQEK